MQTTLGTKSDEEQYSSAQLNYTINNSNMGQKLLKIKI